MRWSCLIALFGLSFTPVASFAQRPPDRQGSASEHAGPPPDAGYFADGIVSFQLVHGRLCLDPPRHRKGSQKRSTDDLSESITVTAERGIPSLHYVRQTGSHQLTLSVQDATFVRCESWFPQANVRAVLEQPELGSIEVTYESGGGIDHFLGDSLLHLRSEDPDRFDQHFGQLVQKLLHGKSIAEYCQATDRELLASLARGRSPDPTRILNCVDDLRSRRRSTRMAAERQLLRWGTPILSTLKEISSDDLDAEQRHRLEIIQRKLRPLRSDTPRSLAMLMINDRAYWQCIAHRLSESEIQLANQHLQRIGAGQLVASHPAEERTARRPGSSRVR